jgi:hypothetical protein
MSNRRHTLAVLSNARHTLRAALRAAVPALVLVATSLVSACSDSSTSTEPFPAAPRVTVSRSVGTMAAPVTVQALLRSAPLAQTIVVSQRITAAGGTIVVPGADFTLEIPRGAFTGQPIDVTVTAYAGNAVAYDFAPHGVAFKKPLKATQELTHTNWQSLNLPSGFSQSAAGAYFADPSQVNFQTGAATVNEFMSTSLSVAGSTLSWDVPHFSGYIVSWGIE